MSKAAPPSSKLTRRKAIAATVAAPALAGPALLTPDPVFAAIAAPRRPMRGSIKPACTSPVWKRPSRKTGARNGSMRIGGKVSERMTIRAGLRRSRRSGLHSAPKRKWRGRWRTRNRPGSQARRPCCAMPASSRRAAASGPAIRKTRKMRTATSGPSYSTTASQRHWRL